MTHNHSDSDLTVTYILVSVFSILGVLVAYLAYRKYISLQTTSSVVAPEEIKIEIPTSSTGAHSSSSSSTTKTQSTKEKEEDDEEDDHVSS